jgi:hypothetical protein
LPHRRHRCADRVNGGARKAFVVTQGDNTAETTRAAEVAPPAIVRQVESVRETAKFGKILHRLLKEVPACAS